MRLAGRMKLGFYPLPEREAERLCACLDCPYPFSALDPCAGDGAAFMHLLQGKTASVYGIELDSGRAQEARVRGLQLVHGSTFAKNDLAMAAGIATLEVIESEKLVEAAAKRGAELRLALTRLVPGYELLKEVRGKGLMIGVEFGPPKSLRLKASWSVLEAASKGLFCQLITVPLFKDHKILTQVSGHGSHTIKLLPPLTITEEDCNWIETAFDTVIASSHKVPGAIWSLGKTLVDNAVRKSA